MPAPHLAQAAVGDEMLLASQPYQPCHLLNSTATMAWQRFDGQTDLETIAEELAGEFAAPRSLIATDVLELTRRLGHMGFLDNVAGSEVAQPGAAPVDSQIGEFELPDLAGHLRSWASFRGRQVLLINWSPYCGHCLHIAPRLGDLKDPLRRQGIELLLITSGAAGPNRSVLETAGVGDVVALCRQGGTDPFAGLGTPVASLYNENGRAATPLAYGASAVADLALQLSTAELENDPGPRPPFLSSGAGICAPANSPYTRRNGESVWSFETATYRLGRSVVGVGFDCSETELTLDRIFPGARVDDRTAPQSCAITLHPSGPTSGRRRLNLLIHSGHPVVRSRSGGRVLRALMGYLSTELYQPDPGLLQAAGVAVVHDGDAYLLPSTLYQTWALVQPRLNRLGLQIVDLPRVGLDPNTSELVVDEPRIPCDISVINELDRHGRTGAELPAAGPGRYPLKRWVIATDHSPSPLTTATSVALAMELITRVPGLQAVLDDLVTLFGRTRGYTVATDPTQAMDQLPQLLATRSGGRHPV